MKCKKKNEKILKITICTWSIVDSSERNRGEDVVEFSAFIFQKKTNNTSLWHASSWYKCKAAHISPVNTFHTDLNHEHSTQKRYFISHSVENQY